MGVQLSTSLAPIMELEGVEVTTKSCLYRYGGGPSQDDPWVSIYIEVNDFSTGQVFFFDANVENVSSIWTAWHGQETLPLLEWLLSKGLSFAIG